MTNLYDLNIGESCRVDKLLIFDSLRRRLIDLGLTPDTIIECVGKSPMGEPRAFLIRGAVIALRREVCEKISVSAVGE